MLDIGAVLLLALTAVCSLRICWLLIAFDDASQES
jgi:hypothetical protein